MSSSLAQFVDESNGGGGDAPACDAVSKAALGAAWPTENLFSSRGVAPVRQIGLFPDAAGGRMPVKVQTRWWIAVLALVAVSAVVVLMIKPAVVSENAEGAVAVVGGTSEALASAIPRSENDAPATRPALTSSRPMRPTRSV
jgi:hypothetical protein